MIWKFKWNEVSILIDDAHSKHKYFGDQLKKEYTNK